MKKSKNNYKTTFILLFIALFILGGVYYFTSSSIAKANKISNLLKEAQLNLTTSSYDGAEKLYKQALEIDPKNQDAHLGLALIKLETDQLEEAKKYLDNISESKQLEKQYKLLLYKYAIKANDFSLAHSIVENNQDIINSAKEYEAIITSLIENNYLMQAKSLIKLAQEKYPQNNSLKILALNLALKLDDEDWALEEFNKGIEDLSLEQLNKISSLYEKKSDINNLIKVLELSLDQNFDQVDLRNKLYKLYAENHMLRKLWDLQKYLFENNINLPKLNLNIQGNSIANVRYSGLATEQGDMIYFASAYKRAIYKSHVEDISKSELVLNKTTKALNVKGEWIYYISTYEGLAIYKVKIDGSSDTMLWDNGKAKDLLVFGEKIYFINENNGKLYNMNMDGSQVIELTQMSIYQYIITPYYICFIDQEGNGIYKQKFFDDRYERLEQAELIIKGRYRDLNIDEAENLYFLDLDSGGNILKADSDNYELKILSKENAEYLNYHGGDLYFVNWTPNKISIEGNNKTSIVSNFSAELAVTPSWIFSLEDALRDFMNVYYFKHDGSGWHILNTFN